MKQQIDDWAAVLLEGGPRHVSLEEVADVIGAAAVTPPEIEALFDRLESAGCRVGEPEGTELAAAPDLLRATLLAARKLRQQTGEAPTVEQIAALAGLEPSAVKTALLYAQVLQR